MNKKRYKFLEERAAQKGKQLFIEEAFVTITPNNIVVFDKTKLVEDAIGEKFEARGILRNVSAARYDSKNVNGRIYPGAIAEHIEKNKLAEGSDCQGNHAESEDSVFDTVGIWHNFRYKEGIGYADLYCIGEGGQLILEKVKAGGKAGFSTVGFGSLLEDGTTVDPVTFEMDEGHFCDWVCHPSAKVYGTYENIVQESTNIKENVKTENNILKESETNKILDKEIKIEETRNDNNMDKMVESGVLRNQARAVFKEAKKSVNYKESIDDLKLLKSTVPSDMEKLHEDIDAMISEVNTKFEEQLSSTGSSLKEKENLLEEITAKYQTLEASHNQLKENFKTCSAIAEKVKDNKDVKALTEMVEKLSKDRILAEADLKQYNEEVALRDKDIACFKKERTGMLEDIKIFKANEKKLKESLTKMVKLVKKLKEDENEDFSDISNQDIIDVDLPEPEDDIMNIDIDSVGDELTDIEDTIEPVEVLDLDELDAEALIAEAEEVSKEDKAAADQSYDAKDEKEMKEEESEEEDSKKDKEEDAKEEKDKEDKEKKSESKIRVRKDVVAHYVEAVKKTPAIKDIKKAILTSKNLYEASSKIKTFLSKKSHESELITLHESTGKKIGTLKDYSFNR
jgi:hypothetical protein